VYLVGDKNTQSSIDSNVGTTQLPYDIHMIPEISTATTATDAILSQKKEEPLGSSAEG